jgi:3-methyladenine DNA glycosylase/8-oxoguanine DNA glycosylase
MIDSGTSKRPKLSISVFSGRKLSRTFLKTLWEEIAFRFDFDSDLNEFERECGSDPLLRPVMNRWRGMRVSAGVSLYEFLVIATVLQNAPVRRSVQMLGVLFQNVGAILRFDGRELSSFWEPEDIARIDEDDLRALKLGYRAKTLKRQAEYFRSGLLDEQRLRQMPTPDLREELLRIYGVGPASVWYLLFEMFKRYDALDHISPWEQKIFSRILFGENEVRLDSILSEATSRWGRWRMLAAHYLFEDLFWRNRSKPIPWLEELIRL